MKLILTADLHLRRDRPRCRLDEDWIGTQVNVMTALFDKAVEHDCDVFVVGDVFQTSTVPPGIENIIPNILKKSKYKNTICFIYPGNHDLKHGRKKDIYKSSIGVLLNTKGVETLYNDVDGKIQFIHTLVWPSKKVKPEPAPGLIPEEVFEMYPKAKYIFAGDYHTAFTVTNDKGQVLVNPGCITRQNAQYKDYEPRAYIVDMDEATVTAFELPDTAPVVTDEYLRREEERDERIDSFIELISSKKGSVSLDFKENLKAKYSKIKAEDREEIESILEEVS